MPYNELPITGYLDRFSHRPGEAFTAFVSVRDGGAYRARLQRVLSGDANPQGPGIHFIDLAARFDRTIEGRHQPILLGSSARVDTLPSPAPDGPRTWTVLAQPTRLDSPQIVLAQHDGSATLALLMTPGGAVAHVTTAQGTLELSTGVTLQRARWYRVWLSIDPVAGELIVGQHALDSGDCQVARQHAIGMRLPGGGALGIAATCDDAPRQHFTGKLEDPAILAGFVAAWQQPLALPDGMATLARWDFSREIGSERVIDIGPSGCHGRLVNLPTRAVVGARWSGREMCWRHAPEDYAAIHFHADDLDDCRWQADFTWTVPDDLPSGAYALHLTCEASEDWLPFYILPRRAGPFAPIAFLASTFTYQAYANHARGNADDAFHARIADWRAYHSNADDYPCYGRSTYNRHLDGSGIAFSSRRRPILTMRPGYITYLDMRGSGLRHYPADTHLLAWLEAKGFDVDIITDEDLDDEGPALLAPYRAVLTGSHPEYHTPGTLDALAAYKAGGGNLAYLGGNGFYWRIARDKAMPHVIELRRAEGGIRAWAAEPGEYYHQLDGGYGGLWRRNRRPPQMLVGVGFSGQGLFEGTHYRLLPAARDPRFGWLFDGIEGDVLGEYGLSGGGAAGFELDRADTLLGTPGDAVILARSEDPPNSVVTVPEELLSHLATWNGEPPEALRRAEIVYFETPAGGAVFSVGSITFCGSLWRDGWQGPVSRLLENLVRRFAAT